MNYKDKGVILNTGVVFAKFLKIIFWKLVQYLHVLIYMSMYMCIDCLILCLIHSLQFTVWNKNVLSIDSPKLVVKKYSACGEVISLRRKLLLLFKLLLISQNDNVAGGRLFGIEHTPKASFTLHCFFSYVNRPILRV